MNHSTLRWTHLTTEKNMAHLVGVSKSSVLENAWGDGEVSIAFDMYHSIALKLALFESCEEVVSVFLMRCVSFLKTTRRIARSPCMFCSPRFPSALSLTTVPNDMSRLEFF